MTSLSKRSIKPIEHHHEAIIVHDSAMSRLQTLNDEIAELAELIQQQTQSLDHVSDQPVTGVFSEDCETFHVEVGSVQTQTPHDAQTRHSNTDQTPHATCSNTHQNDIDAEIDIEVTHQLHQQAVMQSFKRLMVIGVFVLFSLVLVLNMTKVFDFNPSDFEAEQVKPMAGTPQLQLEARDSQDNKLSDSIIKSSGVIQRQSND